MSGLRTEYEFVLPRGYIDDGGSLHRRGVMRLATARDELEPLRDPTVNGPDDPRITILVLARVVRTLGTMELVTSREIEGLFAADLAYLQDFYGIVNFGTQDDIDALLEQQRLDQQREQEQERARSAPIPAGGGSRSSDAPSTERLVVRRAAVEEVPAGER